jgi:hypothetical protein
VRSTHSVAIPSYETEVFAIGKDGTRIFSNEQSQLIPVVLQSSQYNDLINLKNAGCAGAIVGKALYAKAFTLKDALTV